MVGTRSHKVFGFGLGPPDITNVVDFASKELRYIVADGFFSPVGKGVTTGSGSSGRSEKKRHAPPEPQPQPQPQQQQQQQEKKKKSQTCCAVRREAGEI